MKGVKKVGGVVEDAETGQVLGLDVLEERDEDGFMERLGDFVSDCGVEAIVTDGLNTCKPVVERLGLEHQICIAHVRKWAWNRLDWIDGWDWIKARISRLLTELPFDGDLELPRLERAVRDGDATLRRMRVELSGKWRALLCHRRRGDVAAGASTNLPTAVMPPPAGGRPVDEQRDGAGDRQKQDKV